MAEEQYEVIVIEDWLGNIPADKLPKVGEKKLLVCRSVEHNHLWLVADYFTEIDFNKLGYFHDQALAERFANMVASYPVHSDPVLANIIMEALSYDMKPKVSSEHEALGFIRERYLIIEGQLLSRVQECSTLRDYLYQLSAACCKVIKDLELED